METAIIQLEKKLRKGQGHFTVNEASAMTGISVDHTKDALDELIKKYICRLQVTENGDLIYDFGTAPLRRNRISFKEITARAVDFFWNVFVFVFKIWISFTLILYFFISIAVIIALIVYVIGSKTSSSRQSSRSSRDSSNRLISNLFSGVFSLVAELGTQVFGSLSRIFISLFRWKTNTGDVLEQKDQLGYKYKKFKPDSGIINPEKKNFVASVFDFVFGPKRVEIDPLNNEKEVAAYLKEMKGIVVISELIGLAGWTLSQAREFFTDCLIRFKGEVHVSKNGAMFGEFNDIMRGTGNAETGKIIWYWDEYEPEYEVTGNTPGTNGLIFLMNFVILIVSFEITRFFGYIQDILGTNSGSIIYNVLFFYPVRVPADFILEFNPDGAFFFYLYLGIIPLIFSFLFYLIPLIRSIKCKNKNETRIQKNIQKRIYKAIYKVNGTPQTLEQYLTLINRGSKENAIEKTELESVLNELSLDLGGDTTVTENGELVYRFQGIALDFDEVILLRSKRTGDSDLGTVIFDTELELQK